MYNGWGRGVGGWNVTTTFQIPRPDVMTGDSREAESSPLPSPSLHHTGNVQLSTRENTGEEQQWERERSNERSMFVFVLPLLPATKLNYM